MAKRGYNYRPRIRVSNKKGRKLRKTKQVIKKIKRIEESGRDELKITTINGTICASLNEDERYKYGSKWHLLWQYLLAGDTVEITSYAGKILKCTVDVDEKNYIITNFKRAKDSIILTLKNEESEIDVEIKKSDMEKKRIICEDDSKELCWYDICEEEYVIACKANVCIISGRIAAVKFYGFVA